MNKITPFLLSVTVLLIISLACAFLPGVAAPTQDINALGTVVMQTMVAAATRTAEAVIPIEIVESPLPSVTLEVPTATLIPTETSTPLPVFTSTPAIPQVSVSLATNCRVGPGKVYDRVGALQVGQVAEVVGRNQVSNYWYIRNPGQANGFCWLWGEYATVTGDLAALPVLTPPPTPTPMPAFTARYDRIETCKGWWLDFELTNTGGVSFDSVSLTVRDTVTNEVVSTYSDNFMDLDGCVDSSTRDELSPGTSPNVSSPAFMYDPTGHEMQATITACSGEGLNGTCLTQVVRFRP
jgi:hypothetical protein